MHAHTHTHSLTYNISPGKSVTGMLKFKASLGYIEFKVQPGIQNKL